jgi:hypothetical protein
MKAILYLSLFLTLLGQSGCVSYKKCLEKYPPSRDTLRITQVRDSIIYRDTTIYVKIQGETKHDSIFIKIPVEGKLFSFDTLRQDTPLASAEAWIADSYLQLKLTQKDTTILTKLNNAVMEAYHWRSEYEKVTETPKEVKYIPKIYKIAFWIVLVAVIVLAGYLVKKFNLIGIIKTFIK